MIVSGKGLILRWTTIDFRQHGSTTGRDVLPLATRTSSSQRYLLVFVLLLLLILLLLVGDYRRDMGLSI